jgi:transposase
MTIKLDSPTEILILQDEIHRSEDARYDHRLHAILLVAKGMSCPKVAYLLGDSERAVRLWMNRYIQYGLQGLIENERPGRQRRLDANHIARIEEVLRATPEAVGLHGGIWDGKSLSAFIHREFGIKLGVRQCQRLFRQLDFRLRKPRPMIARSDPEVQRAFKKNPANPKG